MTIKFFNNPEKLWKLVGLMIDGAGTTLSIFFLTLLLSVPVGMLVALGRMSKRRIVRAPISFYIYIMRSTPLMLQIMFIYFLLPMILPFRVDRFWAVIFSFVINYAAYFAEIYRGGIESIPVGQYEAAEVLGYSKSQTFLKIILPQMVKRVIPSVTNEVITLVKDTSLVYVIGVVEMFTRAKQIAVAPDSPGIVTLFVAGVFYYVFNFIVAWVMERIEKRLNYYQ